MNDKLNNAELKTQMKWSEIKQAAYITLIIKKRPKNKKVSQKEVFISIILINIGKLQHKMNI